MSISSMKSHADLRIAFLHLLSSLTAGNCVATETAISSLALYSLLMEQSKLPQPLLLWQILQAINQLYCPLLDSPQYVHVSLVPGRILPVQVILKITAIFPCLAFLSISSPPLPSLFLPTGWDHLWSVGINISKEFTYFCISSPFQELHSAKHRQNYHTSESQLNIVWRSEGLVCSASIHLCCHWPESKIFSKFNIISATV